MMKTSLFFILTMVALSFNLQSIDLVAPENLLINNSITYQSTKAQILSSMGNPTSITPEYWEMDEENVEKLIYNGAVFYLQNGKMESFEISGPAHGLKLNNTVIKPGNNISTLQSAFPASYNSRGNNGLSINIAPGDYKFILVHFNANNIITKLEQRYY